MEQKKREIAERFARLPAERQAAFIQALDAQGIAFAGLPIVPLPADQVAPLSYAQRRQWFLWRMDPTSGAYHVAGAVALDGALNVEALTDAFTAIVARHESLRTVVQADEDGLARPAVLPAAPVDLRLVECGDGHDTRAAEAIRDLAQEPFDLTRGPLLRIGLVRTRPERRVLVLVMHHIVSDGASIQLIVDEFVREYRARVIGTTPDLSPPPLRYVDYAAWQRRWMEAGGKHRQLAYWTAQLGAEQPVLQLPADHPRRADGRYRAASHTLAVPRPLLDALRERARSADATLFMVLLAGYQALLHRLTGQPDIRVGSPVANRHRAETAGIVGLFVNTQVLRAVFDGRTRLDALIAATREAVLGAQTHQDLPFEHLVEALQPERSLGTSPLFQAIFNHQRRDLGGLRDLPGLRLSEQALAPTSAQFELALDIVEAPDGTATATFSYAAELFEPASVERFAGHYLRLLDAIAKSPERRLADVVLPGEAEQALLRDWGVNAPRHDVSAPVHELFETQVRARPRATALILGDQRIDYDTLNRRANRLAHRLLALGLAPETRVGVLLERSIDLVVALLAVCKAGGTYVPMDPAYPAQRLAFMAQDSGIGLLLTQSSLAEAHGGAAPRWLVDRLASDGELDAEPDGNPGVPVHVDQLVYVIYTSGSTGLPKGVAVAHAPFGMHCVETAALYEMDAGSLELHFLSFSFDGAQERLFTALCCGAGLVLRDASPWTPDQTLAAMRAHGVTNAGFPPAYLQALAAEARHGGAVPTLRLCSFGGEAMPRAGLALVDDRLGPALLINGYGPTETVVTPVAWKARRGTTVTSAYAPIGRPVGDRTARVLDADLCLLPPGVPGELYLGGQGIARGYLGRAGLTAERFVADPFDLAGGRLYRTGDRVRWSEDGQLEYLGRIDQQLKIQGFRIEPGEIESRLRQQPEVGDAAVIAGQGATGARLIAYVSPRAGRRVEAEVLRARLGQVLPEHMVPAALVVLEALPRTVNGKLDREALPEPALAATRDYAAPQGDAEQALAAIWANLLGVPRVGRNDNFFELGGDSILSLQVVARARRAGWRLAPRQLFEHQSIAALASVTVVVAVDAPATTESAVPATGEVPLLPIQAAFFATPVADRHHWNQAVLLRSDDPLARPALQEALEALLHQHDGLRLRYRQTPDGAWRQTYGDVPDGQRRELLWWRRAADATALTALCDEVQRSLDLANGPLLRALAVEMADGSWRLLLVVHHLVVDGVSWRVLLEDLQTAYARRLAGQPCVPPPRTAGMRDWALALSRRVAGLDGELDHWRALIDVPASMPCDRPEGSNRLTAIDTIELRLDPAATEALLKRAPAAYRTQVNDLLLTALGRALCAWSGHERVLVDLEGHGREDWGDAPDVSRTVGWFTSMFPFALDPLGEPGAALKRVKEALRRVPLRGLGFGLLRHMGSEAQRVALADVPRAQVVFNYLGQVDSGFDAGRWRMATESAGTPMDETAEQSHEFAVNGQVLDGELALRVGYSRERHDAAVVRAWVDRFEVELRALIDHCRGGARGLTPSDVPLAGLDQARLDALPLPMDRIEDLYPLSPMQSGMLFHVLAQPDTGQYLTQLRVDIDGLDPARFRRAWAGVLAAHEVLRTGFLTDLERPLQWVARVVDTPLRELDGLRDAADMEVLAIDEMAAGVDLSRPPLMRLALARTGADRHHLVWTSHHLLLDGWSASQLMGEVLRRYDGQTPLAPPARYRDHIRALLARDAQADETFWRAQLARLDGPSLLTLAVPRPSPTSAPESTSASNAAPTPAPTPTSASASASASAPTSASPPTATGIAHLIHRLDPDATRRLSDAARAQRVTLNTLVQAAWALLLARHTGQSAVVFGTTVSGRPPELAGSQEMLGLFINTLPQVVVPGPADRPVGDWLRQLQADGVAAREHEQTPLYDIQRWAGQGGQALFDSLLVFENYPIDAALRQAAPGGLRFGEVRSQDDTNYPMTVSVHLDHSLTLDYGYDRACFDEATVRALSAQVERLLARLAEAADRPIGRIDAIDEHGRRQLERWGRGAEAHAGPDERIHRHLARHAARRPDAMALRCGAGQLTYAQLDERVNRLAHRLIGLGVRPEARVGIATERSIDMIVAVLATLKAGGVYVPLDPSYPAARLEAMIEDSGIGLLLTQRRVLGTLPVPASVVPVLVDEPAHEPAGGPGAGPAEVPDAPEAKQAREAPDARDDRQAGESADGARRRAAVHDPDVPTHGDQLAYLIYTSGSTGRPKGVGISHAALMRHARVAAGFFDLTERDRVLQFATLNFDGFVEQLFAPLLAGAAIVLRGPTLWDSAEFHAQVTEHGVTVADLSTAYWLLLAQDFARMGLSPPAALRQVHAGGEAMSPEGIRAWREAGLGGVRLLNTYGPTEATVTASVLDCSPPARGDEEVPAQVPIGKPLAGRVMRVVDTDMNLAPPGAAGELCIGGELLARGYWRRPGLSAERFVADPFDGDGGRLYRTGDLVRWNRRGELVYLGRIDHQVKIRGFRIELGEVEAQLLAQPEVREAVVVADTTPDGARLLAYVSTKPGVVRRVDTDGNGAKACTRGGDQSASDEDPRGDDDGLAGGGMQACGGVVGIDGSVLRERLSRSLPDYMLPAVITVLPALPLNANGKIDRKALPAPTLVPASGGEPPREGIESALAAIWGDVLGGGRITRQDHFFERGGHSLLAVRLTTRLRQQFAVELSLQAVFDHPRFADLARWLVEQGASAARTDAPATDAGRFAALLDDLETQD
ncbi:hypothetical protein CDN99_10915 [Roseateles aquatilis]|uniref:Carrier domain-containing protein n=1 Tax=Roseateles aquatilis TaxID=431061 RepID=A0A246JDF8_9BURK|nr:non-ribosomal peptide synthetase [Roseateles aquatilis]OWQ90692.1 hypothetical protein CDN99_10915 [Roseateles aquatilis]